MIVHAVAGWQRVSDVHCRGSCVVITGVTARRVATLAAIVVAIVAFVHSWLNIVGGHCTVHLVRRQVAIRMLWLTYVVMMLIIAISIVVY